MSAYNFGGDPINWMTTQSDVRFSTEEYTCDVGGALRSTRSRMYDAIRTGYEIYGRPLADSVGGVEVRRFAYDPRDRWVMARNAESTDSVFTAVSGAVDSVVTRRGSHGGKGVQIALHQMLKRAALETISAKGAMYGGSSIATVSDVGRTALINGGMTVASGGGWSEFGKRFVPIVYTPEKFVSAWKARFQ